MSEWPLVELQSVADLTGGNAFKSSEYSEKGMFILRTLNISDDCAINKENAKFIPQRLVEQYSRFALQERDTLFVMVGATLGKVGFVRRKNLPALLNQNMWRLRAKSGRIDPIFLHYCFRHFCKIPLEWMSGSARGFVRRDDYRKLQIPLPAINEQCEIGAALGALDDKIEVNRKTVATLEAMARALYKSWFMDFDPVHARSQGQPPAHMDQSTAALFPERFSDHGLPEGWEFDELGNLCSQGKTSVKPMQQTDQVFQHFSLPAYDKEQTAPFEFGAEIKSNKVLVPEDAILFSRLNPRIPRVWWAKTSPEIGIPACSTEFFVAEAPMKEGVPFLYCALSSDVFLEDALARIAGTSGSHQRVSPDALKSIYIIRPTDEIIHEFGKSTQTWFDKIHLIAKENQTLATLRDTLLPKLMSGELRVGAAREQVEEVV